jgi:hypothetical protein
MESDIRILAEGLMFPEGPVAMAMARSCWLKSSARRSVAYPSTAG